MREKFIKWAEIICTGKSILTVLKELKKVCAKENLYHEEGGCLEKIWHITHEDALYKEVGDIFLYKVRNRDIANAAYNKYLYHTNPDFYFKYATNLSAMGFNCADTENLDEELPEVILSLCDRFDAIVYMMICLHKNKDYDGVLELEKYLTIIKSKIEDYKNKTSNDNKTYWEDIQYTEKHLSKILSQTQNHNDINKFAIRLNKENKKAYFNILKDLITYNNFENALKFYNNNVCENFDLKPTGNIKSLCWIVSDFYRDIFEFYNAVFMQKIIIDMELEEENIHA